MRVQQVREGVDTWHLSTVPPARVTDNDTYVYQDVLHLFFLWSAKPINSTDAIHIQHVFFNATNVSNVQSSVKIFHLLAKTLERKYNFDKTSYKLFLLL